MQYCIHTGGYLVDPSTYASIVLPQEMALKLLKGERRCADSQQGPLADFLHALVQQCPSGRTWSFPGICKHTPGHSITERHQPHHIHIATLCQALEQELHVCYFEIWMSLRGLTR